MGSVISNIELSQPASLCFKSQQGMGLLDHIPDNQWNQTIDCQRTKNCSNNLLWCHFSSGIFFVCRTNAYSCLLANWTGTCTLAFLIPQMNIIPINQSLIVPLAVHTWSKRAIQVGYNPVNWARNHCYNRDWCWRNSLISLLLSEIIQRPFRWYRIGCKIFSSFTG